MLGREPHPTTPPDLGPRMRSQPLALLVPHPNGLNRCAPPLWCPSFLLVPARGARGTPPWRPTPSCWSTAATAPAPRAVLPGCAIDGGPSGVTTNPSQGGIPHAGRPTAKYVFCAIGCVFRNPTFFVILSLPIGFDLIFPRFETSFFNSACQFSSVGSAAWLGALNLNTPPNPPPQPSPLSRTALPAASTARSAASLTPPPPPPRAIPSATPVAGAPRQGRGATVRTCDCVRRHNTIHRSGV